MTAADVERLRGHCQHTTDSIWELQGLLESQTEENNVLKQQLHAAHVAYETLQREQQHTHKGALEHMSTAKGRQHEHMKVLRKLDEARAQIDDQTVKLVEAAALQEALVQMEHKLAITHNSTTASAATVGSTTATSSANTTATAGAAACSGSTLNSSNDAAGVTQLPLQQLPSPQDRLQALYDRAKLQGKLEGLASKANKVKQQQQQQQQSNAVKRRTSVTVTATATPAVSAAVTTSQQWNSIRRASSKRRLSTVNVTAASSNSESTADDSDASSTQQQQQRSVKRENSIASLPRVQEAAAATAAVANNVSNVRASSSGYGNGPRHSSVRAATATPASALRKASIQPAIELKHRASQVLAVKPADVVRTTTATASTQTVVIESLPVPPAVHSKQRSQDHAVQCELLSSNSSSSSDVSAVSMRLPPVVSPIRQSGAFTQQRHSVSVKRINVDTFAVIPDAVTAQLRPITAVSPLAVPAKPSVAQSDAPVIVQRLEVAEVEPFHVQKHKLRKWQPHDTPATIAAVSPQTDTTSIDNSNNSSSSRGAAQCVASALLGKQSNDDTAVQEQSDTTNIASVHATVSDSSGSHNAREGSATAGLKDNSQHSQEAAVKHQQKKQQQQQQQQHKLQTIEDGTPCDDSSVGDYGSVHSATNASQFAAASTVSMSSMSSALSDNMLFITVMQESSGSYALKTLLQELLSLCTAVLQPTDGHVSHKALMHHATVLHSTGIPLLKRILRGYGLVSSRWNHSVAALMRTYGLKGGQTDMTMLCPFCGIDKRQ
eukprot:11911-Heterococcus_DN1.PRE.3